MTVRLKGNVEGKKEEEEEEEDREEKEEKEEEIIYKNQYIQAK